jgi:hypothetical protein
MRIFYCLFYWDSPNLEGQVPVFISPRNRVAQLYPGHWVMFQVKFSVVLDRLCGLVVRVHGYTTEMYCDSCEVRTEFICYVEESRPPLWSSGQSSWLQIQRSGNDCRRYQILWEVVGLERGPLSLVSTIEELLGGKSSGSGLENREYDRRDSSRGPRGSLYTQKLALTTLTNGCRSVGRVRSRTQATEFSLVVLMPFPT